MAISTAPDRHAVVVGETRTAHVAYTALLNSGESLTGTPTIVEDGSSDLTITNKAVTTAVQSIDGVDVPAGEAVGFSFSGQSASTEYTVKITVGTDASPAQTFVRRVVIPAEA